MILGLTGTFASGKGTMVEYLKKKGFASVTLSDILREEARKRGRPLDRMELAKIGEELKRAHGFGILADLAVKRMRSKKHYVIDGIRNVGEIERLRKEKVFFLIAVDAPVRTRFEREQARGREQNSSFGEFMKRQATESSNNPYYMQLQECMDRADFHMENDGTIKELGKRMDLLLKYAKDAPLRKRISSLVGELSKNKGNTMLASLKTKEPWMLLVSTILSARSKDEMTLPVSLELFKRYPTIESLANAKKSDVGRIIKKIGFYKNKSSFIIGTAKRLLDDHNGTVPRTMEELTRLPGVGRKVANCVLVYAFQIPAIPVDTHVHRISNRLGLIRSKTPKESERELMLLLPRKHWLLYNDLLVWHGKTVCKPIGPRCRECRIAKYCDKVGVEKKYYSR